MDDKLTVYIAVLTACLVLQTIVIVAAALVILKLRSRMEAMAGRLEEAEAFFMGACYRPVDDAQGRRRRTSRRSLR